mmetsp:Transcript_4074/g.10176  ORF Transcript_4074/g.10176 Transcript_4074/m.10176 type:complete len:219 (-) Transcript_4074:99-755(-)
MRFISSCSCCMYAPSSLSSPGVRRCASVRSSRMRSMFFSLRLVSSRSSLSLDFFISISRRRERMSFCCASPPAVPAWSRAAMMEFMSTSRSLLTFSSSSFSSSSSVSSSSNPLGVSIPPVLAPMGRAGEAETPPIPREGGFAVVVKGDMLSLASGSSPNNFCSSGEDLRSSSFVLSRGSFTVPVFLSVDVILAPLLHSALGCVLQQESAPCHSRLGYK